MDARCDRSGAGSRLQQWEWLFPLRGRWLRIFLAVVWRFGLFLYLIAGLAVAEFVPRLASARNVQMTVSGQWDLSQEYPAALKVNYLRGPIPTVLRLGPFQFKYDYPGRLQRHAPERTLGLVLRCVVFGYPLIVARLLGPRGRFPSFAWKLGAVALVLMFPQAIACGPLGCRTICVWHAIYYGLRGLSAL